MVAVVTGGVRGLGKSFTLYLLSLGYEVYAIYNKSEKIAHDLENMHESLKCIKCDISNEEEVKSTLNSIGGIDLLINNAGIAIDNEYYDKTIDEFMSVIKTNLGGTFLMTKYAINNLLDDGIIINISSNNSLDNYSKLSIDYDASKAGINIMTKDFALILDEIGKNQKIFAILPGWINTESIQEMNQEYLKEEMKRVNQETLINPDDLAKYIIDNMSYFTNGEIKEIKEV